MAPAMSGTPEQVAKDALAHISFIDTDEADSAIEAAKAHLNAGSFDDALRGAAKALCLALHLITEEMLDGGNSLSKKQMLAMKATCKKAVHLLQGLNDTAGEAAATLALAYSQLSYSVVAAETNFRRALELAKELDDMDAKAMATRGLVSAIIVKSATQLSPQLDIVSNKEEVMESLSNRHEEWMEEGLKLSRGLVQMYRKASDRREEAGACLKVAQVYRAMMDNEESKMQAHLSRRIYRDQGDKHGEMNALKSTIVACFATPQPEQLDFDEALQAAKEILGLYGRVRKGQEGRKYAAEAFHTQAKVQLTRVQNKVGEADEQEKAVKAAENALSIYEELKDWKREIAALTTLGTAHLHGKDYGKASEAMKKSQSINEKNGEKSGAGMAIFQQAIVDFESVFSDLEKDPKAMTEEHQKTVALAWYKVNKAVAIFDETKDAGARDALQDIMKGINERSKKIHQEQCPPSKTYHIMADMEGKRKYEGTKPIWNWENTKEDAWFKHLRETGEDLPELKEQNMIPEE